MMGKIQVSFFSGFLITHNIFLILFFWSVVSAGDGSHCKAANGAPLRVRVPWAYLRQGKGRAGDVLYHQSGAQGY